MVPEGRREKAILAGVAVSLALTLACGFVAARYAGRADAAWNRQGYDRAYRDVSRELSAGGRKTVDRAKAAKLAGERMWEPRYVPERSLGDQRVANAFGLAGFFSLFVFAGLSARYLYLKRVAVARLFGRRRGLDRAGPTA